MAVYRVKRGDTLSGIADHFGLPLGQIRAANPQIRNINRIEVGDAIFIPEPSAPPVAPAGGSVYVVVEGDTLSGIAVQFGRSQAQLLAANPDIVNPDLIFVGQQLVIPPAGAPTTRPLVSEEGACSIPNTPNMFIGFPLLWPCIQAAAKEFGADAKVMTAIVHQESGFKNFLIHFDGTGHGLIGLDDNGLKPSFEAWCGQSFGKGEDSRSIPPSLQVRFLAKTIGELTQLHGDAIAAAREWHAGRGGMNGAHGVHYEALIRGHIAQFFG